MFSDNETDFFRGDLTDISALNTTDLLSITSLWHNYIVNIHFTYHKLANYLPRLLSLGCLIDASAVFFFTTISRDQC